MQLTYEPRTSGRSPAKRASAKKKVRRVGPKRAMTAYFCFATEARSRIAADRPELSMTEQAKEMGALWKRMSDSEKQKYIEMAQKDRERYESEKAEYDKDFPQPAPKRKNTRWSAEEIALLKSVSSCLAARMPAWCLSRAERLTNSRFGYVTGRSKVRRRQLVSHSLKLRVLGITQRSRP